VRRRALLAALAATLGVAAPARADLAASVDPMIGTFAPGFVFPGPSVPFGMVQNSPDTVDPADLAYTGYLYHDPAIRGFSLVHLNGPGVHKAGDLPFMPTLGPATSDPSQYLSPFTHAREKAEAGYYAVTLDASQTKVELTASTHAAMQRYTFPPNPDAKVIMDTARSVEGVTEKASWKVTGPNEITGYREDRYPVYFVAQFSRPFKASGDFAGKGGWVSFDTLTDASSITMRAGVSFVDAEGARENLLAEADGFDFDAMRAEARHAWNRELSTAKVDGGNPLDRRTFYTALFHAFQHPNVFTDVDGRYRGFDDAVHVARGRTQYANFSSWDTYKAQNQLLALLQPKRFQEMLESLLVDAQQGGRLPRWGEQNFDASHMSGDPAIPMIADAQCRGLLTPRLARDLYAEAVELRSYRDPVLDEKGYLPLKPGTTLEYGIADFALALLADSLGEDAEAERWLKASLNYRNLLDPETKWIRPREANGDWYANFDPAFDETGFQEGNSWQYSWLAPHDARGLFERMGGDAAVGERWDTFFALPAPAQNQATFFGTVYRLPQYAPGNEHDIQAPWMPAFAGQPWRVAEVMRNARMAFRPTPDGMPGNDDLGSLSAWYVFSALGFGPVTPGAPFHVVGSPVFERVTLKAGKKRFTISAPGTSPAQPYVQAASLDGKPLSRNWFTDAAIRDGGGIALTMGPQKSAWGTGPAAVPPSASNASLSDFGCEPAKPAAGGRAARARQRRAAGGRTGTPARARTRARKAS
jgi:predicted alpha-1,2-mannosidase